MNTTDTAALDVTPGAPAVLTIDVFDQWTDDPRTPVIVTQCWRGSAGDESAR